MWVVLNAVGRVGAGLGLDAFVGLVLVVVGGGRRAPDRFCRSTFEEIRCDPTDELGWERCVVGIRRSCHPCAVTMPTTTGATNEVAVDDEVSTVADVGCMLHVREIDTPTLDAELTQSCPRVAPELTTPRNPLHPNAFSELADQP
jgi:hypothetical protein